MAIQRFTLEAIQKVRNTIQAEIAAANTSDPLAAWSGPELPMPSSLDELGDIFTFGGQSEAERAELVLHNPWSISTFNPAVLLLKLPGLWLKPSYRLVSYLCRTAADGAGLIFALPEALSTTAHLQSALTQATIANPPQPTGALPHFMAAIDGNRSAASFVVAFLLRRELQEFGALGKHQTWSHHHLIQSLPAKLRWQWCAEMPKDCLPKAIVLPDGQAAVELFSCRLDVQQITLYRHVERYPAEGYRASVLDKVLAVAKRGG